LFLSKKLLGFSIHFLNILPVLGRDFTTLQFHRRSQDSVFRSPFLGVESHVLDQFKRLLSIVFASLSERLNGGLEELFVLQNRGERSCDTACLCEVHRLVLVGESDGDDEGLVRVDVDADAVGHNEVVLDVHGFECLHRDVLAVSVLGERLRTADDLERAVGLKLTDVAGREESIFQKRLLRLVLLLVVALGDGGSANEDLAARGRVGDLELVDAAELDFAARKKLSDVFKRGVVVVLDRGGTGRFSEAIALSDGAAKDDGQPLLRRGRERRAARDHELDVAAEGRRRGGEDSLVEEGRVEAALERVAALGEGAVEERALQRADGRKLRLDAFLDRVVNSRHAGEEQRLELLQIAVRAGGGVRQRARVAVAEPEAVHEHDVLGGELEDVGERQVRAVGRLALGEVEEDLEAHVQGLDRGEDVALRKHDALGVAGRARRVHDQRKRLGRGRDRAGLGQARAGVDDGLPRADLRLLPGGRRRVALVVGGDDGGELDAVLAAERDELLDLLRRADNGVALGLLEGVDERVLAEVGVDGHDGGAGEPRAVARHEPLPAGLLVEGDLLAGLDAELDAEAVGEGDDLAPDLRVREVLRLAEVQELPLLLVALLVEDLLLGGLDDVAEANGNGLRELGARRLEHQRHRLLGGEFGVDFSARFALGGLGAADDVVVALFDVDRNDALLADQLHVGILDTLEVVDGSEDRRHNRSSS
jgi:hypothetical protein